MRSLPRGLSRLVVGALASILVLPACSGAGSDDSADDSADDAGVSIPVTDSPDVTSAAAPTAPIGDAAEVPTTVPPVVADTGVPGLGSDDAFCRSWSEFAGSFQALALAASRAVDPSQWARAEVAAAPTIVDAVAGLHEHLPDELEPEREALAVGLVGPLARRAGEAIVALTAAGLTDAEIAAVGTVWLATLTAAGLDEPIDDIVLDPDVADRFDGAVAAFAATRPSIVEDPALVTDPSTPLTFAYLADHCPDQGTLAGNDVVDQP
ncbi:MAG: hypothetical protein ABWZ42_10800 [Ilumatobacteraceae bacterium]